MTNEEKRPCEDRTNYENIANEIISVLAMNHVKFYQVKAIMEIVKAKLRNMDLWKELYEEKANKLALDDLSCESIEQLANHLHKALESTLKSNS